MSASKTLRDAAGNEAIGDRKPARQNGNSFRFRPLPATTRALEPPLLLQLLDKPFVD